MSREATRRWKEEHPEAVREHNRRAQAEWRKRNPRKHCEVQSRRKARIRETTVEPVSYDAILRRYGFHCHICNQEIEIDELSFDHVIPLAVGGSHTEDNIKPAHLDCNIKKGARV